MYLEKKFLIEKIDEFCKLKNIKLTYSEKNFLSSQVSRLLDKERLLSFEEFIELVDHNEQLEQYNDIEFNDEIISIEEIDPIEMIDFDISGNHLFYVNGILTHNSAVNAENADNSNVSDSIGTVMTADFMLFLLQTEEMKEKCEIICKITKNRFCGMTDTWCMNIDYEHMRFNEMVIQNPLSQITEIDEATGEIKSNNLIDDDFGIKMVKKQEQAEKFATQEIKDILVEDIQKIREFDAKNLSKTEVIDPFSSDQNDIFKELGIEL